ncbi:MAG: H-NS histone family protein [Rhodocyclales bacterium]|nr:H-NS histone family protein [Rhodocyclales bacterium]
MSSYQELLAQRAELDRQIAAAQRAEKAAAIAAVKKLVGDFGLSAEECGFRPAGKGKAKTTVAAAFRGPNGETWSGRGRTPNWLSALEKQGQSRDRFRIAG